MTLSRAALVLLLALFVFPGAAHADQLTVTDPADAPGSAFDIEQARFAYEPLAGTITVTWRLQQALPESVATWSLKAELAQARTYSMPCGQAYTAGDLKVNVAADSFNEPRAKYVIDGIVWDVETPLAISDDRRELTVSVTDPSLAGRSFFCARASSADVVPDEASSYFPGFAPAAAVLSPGTLFRGTSPVLTWDPIPPDTIEGLEFYVADPGTGAQPTDVHHFPDGPPAVVGGTFAGRFERTPAGVAFTVTGQLPDGVYWWAIRREFGTVGSLRSVGRFEIGPPDLTKFTLRASVKAPKRFKAAGRVSLSTIATRGATIKLVIRRGTRTVRKFDFFVGTDQQGRVRSPQLTLPLSCSTPGRYTVKGTATDRYGKRLNAATSWSVSRTRCARLKRAVSAGSQGSHG